MAAAKMIIGMSTRLRFCCPASNPSRIVMESQAHSAPVYSTEWWW